MSGDLDLIFLDVTVLKVHVAAVLADAEDVDTHAVDFELRVIAARPVCAQRGELVGSRRAARARGAAASVDHLHTRNQRGNLHQDAAGWQRVYDIASHDHLTTRVLHVDDGRFPGNSDRL